ncbi:MAG: DUF2007 domain-containing protein [Bacteroidota bacterium]
MDKDWAIIFSAEDFYKVELYRSLLEENGIESIVINKQDSMYVTINAGIELYVKRDNVIQAMHLLENSEQK